MSVKGEEQQERLFVPLNSEPWRAFERGEKGAEFRGVNNQFNRDTVVVGRTVELRRGYSTDDSLWGVITEVEVDNNLGDLVEGWFDDLQYGNRSLGEVAHSVNEQVGDYDEYIVFGVSIDGGETTPISERLEVGVTNDCDNCGSENISGQVHCAVCGGLVNDV